MRCLRYLGLVELIVTAACVVASARRLSQLTPIEGCNEQRTHCTLPAESLEPADEHNPSMNLSWPSSTTEQRSLNPVWTHHLPCMYGELPGSWLPEMQPTIQDFKNEHQTIRFEKGFPPGISNVTHGSGWQLFSPKCKLHNYLHDFLMLRKPAVPEVQRPINVIIMGDSVDRISVEVYLNILEALYNNTDKWAELNPRTLEYGKSIVETDNGFNMYYSPHGATLLRDSDEVGVRDAQEARNNWKRWRNDSVEPDAILVNSAYWDLHELDTNKGFNHTDLIVAPAYLNRWMEAVSKMLHELRRQFPKAYIVWRTAPHTRVAVDTGEPDGHKEWSYKMHIAQINAAARHVMKVHGIPLVDLELLCAGLTPTQGNFDIHHPRDFFTMVYINVFLNYVMQYLVALA